jgi:hypothetical protein
VAAPDLLNGIYECHTRLGNGVNPVFFVGRLAPIQGEDETVEAPRGANGTMNPSDFHHGPPRLRFPLYAAVDAPPASPGRVSSTALFLYRNMPSLLPRKISAAASFLLTAEHGPSPYVHWVGIFRLIDEATPGFALATACCIANWELTTPCCQGAAPLSYQGPRTTPWARL